MIEVTQADRDAAAQYSDALCEKRPEIRTQMLFCLEEDFARHRIASQAELIEALNWALSEIHGHARYNGERQFGDCLSQANEVLAKAKGEG